tara:strand:- start:342 stop:725 length:384 start_codon:yes stop_codon:yes gene_type:complete
MSLTNAFETSTLQYLFTTGSVTRPTAWYLGLFTSDPTETGSAGTEVSGGGYVRKAVTFTVSGNLATNSAAIEWSAATSSWGTVTHIAVLDASSGGNMIASNALTTAKAVATDDIIRVPAGDLDITLD